MVNVIVGLVILLIVSLSVIKIISEKRKGVKCVGCPHGCSNSSKCNC